MAPPSPAVSSPTCLIVLAADQPAHVLLPAVPPDWTCFCSCPSSLGFQIFLFYFFFLFVFHLFCSEHEGSFQWLWHWKQVNKKDAVNLWFWIRMWLFSSRANAMILIGSLWMWLLKPVCSLNRQQVEEWILWILWMRPGCRHSILLWPQPCGSALRSGMWQGWVGADPKASYLGRQKEKLSTDRWGTPQYQNSFKSARRTGDRMYVKMGNLQHPQ